MLGMEGTLAQTFPSCEASLGPQAVQDGLPLDIQCENLQKFRIYSSSLQWALNKCFVKRVPSAELQFTPAVQFPALT